MLLNIGAQVRNWRLEFCEIGSLLQPSLILIQNEFKVLVQYILYFLYCSWNLNLFQQKHILQTLV